MAKLGLQTLQKIIIPLPFLPLPFFRESRVNVFELCKLNCYVIISLRNMCFLYNNYVMFALGEDEME